jgi:hypothetical protein
MYVSPAANDKHFVRRALLQFGKVLRERGFNHVLFVSDGGPKHFKTKSSIFFITVQLKRHFGFRSVEWHFWPANHGKWSYDGMAACVKRELYIVARARDILVTGAPAIAEHANRLRNMDASAFPYVDNSEPFDVDGFAADRLRSFHAFRCRGAAKGANGLGQFQVDCLVKSTDPWPRGDAPASPPALQH